MTTTLVTKRYKIRIRVQLLMSLFLMATQGSFAQTSAWYNFNGVASLEIKYINNTRANTCKVYSYKMFPEEYIDIKDTLSSGSGTKTYKIPVSWPQKVTVSLPGIVLPILLVPGAHLVCVVDLSDIKNVRFETADSLSIINEYLMKKEFQGSASFKNKRSAAFQSAKDLTAYSVIMNELYKKEMQFFIQNKDKLPAWFQTYEYWDIRYGDAISRLNIVGSMELSNKKAEPISVKYYSFLDSLPINNESAKNIEPYYLFLYELFNKRLKEEKFDKCKSTDFLPFHICQAEMELSRDVQDVYKAWFIQLVFVHYKKDVAKEYIKQNASIFADPIWLEKLQIYFRSKEKFLTKNMPAPNFALTDLKDSLTTLREQKGNVVVLSFWYAGCKPCIEEFPFENALAEKYKNQQVKIINVCVNTTEENWRRYSERFGLKTINLWANPQWEKTVIEKYALTEFPRYVLLDKNLNTVETNAERPSKGLENQVITLLNK